MRGYWWSPTAGRCWSRGSTTPRCSAGTSPTRPTPTASPTVVAYPAAGTPTPWSRSSCVGLDGTRVDGRVGRRPRRVPRRTPCGPRHELLIVVQSRDQRALRVLGVDPATGRPRRSCTRTPTGLGRDRPRRAGAHRVAARCVWITDDDGARRLLVDGEPVTPPTCRSAPCSTSTATPCCSAPPTTRPRPRCGPGRPGRAAVPHPGARRARRAAGRRDARREPAVRSTPTARSTTVRAGGRRSSGRSPRSPSRPG